MSNEKLETVPKLRFPEFENSKAWKEKEVGNIFNITRGYVLSMSLVKDKWEKKYPYPVFSSQTKNNGLAGYYSDFLYKNAITWTTDGANAGDVKYRDGKFYCTNVCGVLINTDGYANSFVAELINLVSKRHVSYVGNPKLMNGVMSKIIVPFPTLKEQQKIAACLSSLDEFIALQTQKIDDLKTHKKGLMQQLFPVEGKTSPSLRFPEFENNGEWMEIVLGNIADIITGTTPKTSDPKNYEGEKLFVSPADISEKRYVVKTNKTLSELGFSMSRVIPKNSIMFVCIGSTIGKVAQNKFECATNQQINSLVPFDNHSNDFIYSTLENSSSKIASLAGRQAVPLINKSDFSAISIYIPPSKQEQQKIAACLTSLDKLITTQTQKIDNLKTHKKGLMQQLFPAIN